MNNPFPYPIKEEITLQRRLDRSIVHVFDCKIILLDWKKIPKDSPDFQRNVACLDESGNVIWQIERLSHYFGDAQKDDSSYYYFGMTVKHFEINGNPVRGLLLYNVCDVNLLVNYKTGEIIEKKIMNNPFPYPINKEIIIGDYRIVVLDWQKIPNDSPDLPRNVACLDKSNNIVWQIERFEKYPGNRSSDNFCYYIGATLVNNQLVLSNVCSLRVTVDYKTGKVLNKKEQIW